MSLKWGIVSAGKICHDFVNALSTLPDGEHEVVAVAARQLKNAQDFANLHNIPNAYEGYEALANDKNCQICYIGNLNPQHFEVALMMLEHGKHILCEKPMCLNEKQTKKLIQYAEMKKLFLMEAIWSRFFPSYQYIRKQINSGVLGDIKEVTAEFGFNLIDKERLTKKDLGGGTVLDLGVYTIQVCQWAFQQPPKLITATGQLNNDGVDVAMDATLEYGNGGKGIIKTSALEELSNQAIITGTKGKIILPNFWCPTRIIDIDGKEKVWPLPIDAKHKFNFTNSCGLRYQAQEVKRCINEKLLQSDSVKHNESIIIAQIEDEIRKQIGVKYIEDD